jgi:hypothetical protein
MAGLKTCYSRRLVNRMDSSRRKLARGLRNFPQVPTDNAPAEAIKYQIRCGIRLAHVMHVLVRS